MHILALVAARRWTPCPAHVKLLANPFRILQDLLVPAHRLLPRAAAVTIAMFAGGAAQAAELFFEDIPIVLTASRIAQSPLDAPVAVSVIDREMIRASGFTEIHDLLRLVPGFLVADWPEGSPVVARHGLGDAYDRRIKVMVDGRTVNRPLSGDTAWLDLPVRVDDIERVEVVRGRTVPPTASTPSMA